MNKSILKSTNSDLLFDVSSGSATASSTVAEEYREVTQEAIEDLARILYEQGVTTYPPQVKVVKRKK